MIRRYLFLYLFALTIPLFLGFAAWQSVRYTKLERNVRRLEAVQEELIESNKRLIGNIALLSSSERIARIAAGDLELAKMRPEDVLQIRIEGGQEP